MPIPGENVNDFIYSADNIEYGEWQKKFAWWPVRTVTKQVVWMRTVYTRTKRLKVEPPQFPVNSFNKREWATWEQITEYKLTGIWS